MKAMRTLSILLAPLFTALIAGRALGTPLYHLTDLGTLGGTVSAAYGINAPGQVVGQAAMTGNNVAQNAFLYSGGTMTNLGTLGGPSSRAYAVNLSGQVVGNAFTNSTAFRAFLYSGGAMANLGTLPGYSNSEAYGINASGQVVGDAYVSNFSDSRAFLYSGGTMHDLGTLGGQLVPATVSMTPGRS